ncbi:DNA-directed RNA polymerases I and III subunit [Theileria orientalis]|uniref:DNA-directed RNA polymerases I and III subunit n=1 Tax=Theileria orientalis TaxID=68886 RepID=A0A976MBX4_THEOR|nr:DNA-directed RNA polymerases I and III subunit [Theileria orientalis]
MANSVFLESSGIKPCYEDSSDSSKDAKIIEKVKNLRVNFLKKTDSHSMVEIEGLDVSFANALRRILLSEVPTLAVETVQIYQNTGVIQDELLAHRLGLIPFNVNPDLFTFKNCEEINDKNSICFKLKVKYDRNESNPGNYLPVYSSYLKWVPLSSNQENTFKDNPPKPVHDNILITKLAPGQEIDLNVYLEKGTGKVHAKWSPVSTAFYKFMPSINISNTPKLTDSEKRNLANICPMDVFSIKNNEISVENPLNCTSCRKCLETYPKHVTISKLVNHIIFSIESTGSIPSYDLLLKAVDILKTKSIKLKNKLQDSI